MFLRRKFRASRQESFVLMLILVVLALAASACGRPKAAGGEPEPGASTPAPGRSLNLDFRIETESGGTSTGVGGSPRRVDGAVVFPEVISIQPGRTHVPPKYRLTFPASTTAGRIVRARYSVDVEGLQPQTFRSLGRGTVRFERGVEEFYLTLPEDISPRLEDFDSSDRYWIELELELEGSTAGSKVSRVGLRFQGEAPELDLQGRFSPEAELSGQDLLPRLSKGEGVPLVVHDLENPYARPVQVAVLALSPLQLASILAKNSVGGGTGRSPAPKRDLFVATLDLKPWAVQFQITKSGTVPESGRQLVNREGVLRVRVPGGAKLELKWLYRLQREGREGLGGDPELGFLGSCPLPTPTDELARWSTYVCTREGPIGRDIRTGREALERAGPQTCGWELNQIVVKPSWAFVKDGIQGEFLTYFKILDTASEITPTKSTDDAPAGVPVGRVLEPLASGAVVHPWRIQEASAPLACNGLIR